MTTLTEARVALRARIALAAEASRVIVQANACALSNHHRVALANAAPALSTRVAGSIRYFAPRFPILLGLLPRCSSTSGRRAADHHFTRRRLRSHLRGDSIQISLPNGDR